MDGIAVAEALALRLREVVPPGYLIEADAGLIGICPAGSSTLWCAIDIAAVVDQGGDAEYFIRAACYFGLGTVQDMIMEHTTELWPGTVPTVPGVAIESGMVRLWYGDENRTLLHLRAIELVR